MPVAVHGIEQKAVRNLAPAACAPLPGEGAGRHRGRLGAAARIHHGLLFPYIAILRGDGGEMRAKPLGFQGRGASAGGAGGRGDVLAEAGKGRRGLRAAFFFFFLNAQL